MFGFLANRFFRIDARSVGLFRIAFGLGLIFDLFHRWDWLKAFYSNRGVLPNHNHLFNLRKTGGVWSALHSFSREDEAFTAFCIFFVIYLLFTLGFHTRSMQALSIVVLVSLCGRNTLLDNPGNSVAVVLALLSLMLPLGQRFSIDSVRRSFAANNEKTAAELNDNSLDANLRAPASPAALALVLFIGFVPLADSLAQQGASWHDGHALYYALHTDRWTSALGVQLRQSVGLLSTWTQALHYAGFAVLPLALLPVAPRALRPLALFALLFWGLSYALLFTFGLYGWSLVAAAFLLVPSELWSLAKDGQNPIEVVYDDDCGFCLLAARWLKRLDRRDRVHFVANSSDDLPAGTPRERLDETVVVVKKGAIYCDIDAIREIWRVLPIPGWWLCWLPGLRQLGRLAYYAMARNRYAISTAMGLGSCGVAAAQPASARAKASATSSTPAARWSKRLGNLFALLLVGLVLLLVAAGQLRQQQSRNGKASTSGWAHGKLLVKSASFARIGTQWSPLAPEPPRSNEGLVVAAETRNGWKVDPLTGFPPDTDLNTPSRRRMGVLWSSYLKHLSLKENSTYRSEFKRYLNRGGYAVDTKKPGQYIAKLNAYWVSKPIAAPGQKQSQETTRFELFGGRSSPVSPRRKLRHLRGLKSLQKK